MKAIHSEEDIIYLIRRLNKSLQNDFDSRLAEYGLTSQQGRILFYVNKKTNIENAVVHQNDIEKAFFLTKSTISGLVKRMEKNGLIERIPDHQYTIIRPTKEGQEIVDHIFARRTETIDKLLKGLSGREQNKLIELIKKLRENMEGDKNDVAKN